MLKWLHERAASKRYAHDLYGSIVTLTRNPALYRDHNVPDTIEGRFETLILHLFLMVERIHQDDPALAQKVVDLFFKDMDTTSRELGVGDMVVPKKMRGLAGVFQERMDEYRTGTKAEKDKHLATVFAANAIEEKHDGKTLKSLKTYISDLRLALSDCSLDKLSEESDRFSH